MGNKRTNTKAKGIVDQLSRPSPRINLRGRLNENVTHIAGNEYNEAASVLSGQSFGYGAAALNPGNTAGRANAPVNAVGRYFQKGLYLPGTFFRYIPSVGLNTPGNFIVGWIDSPDMIRAWFALVPAARLNFIRDLNNAKTTPVWQELTMPLTQPPRRKTFMVDPAIDITIDSIDQSTQGLFVFAIYGVDVPSADKVFGQIMIHCKERFEEVKSFVTPQPS